MNILTLALMAASMAGAGSLPGPARAAQADDRSAEAAARSATAPAQGFAGVGGGDDRIEEPPAADLDVVLPTIVVEGRGPAPDTDVWTIAPDPALARRYDAAGDRRLNRVIVRF